MPPLVRGIPRSAEALPDPDFDRRRDLLAASDPACVGDLHDPRERLAVLGRLALTGAPDLPGVRGLHEAHPTAASAALVAGHHVLTAWTFRGAARAQYVLPEARKPFEEHLAIAASSVEEALGLDHSDPLANLLALKVNRAYGAGADVAFGWFARIQSTAPWVEIACAELVQAIAPKWHGSFDALLTYADHAVREAPEGSPALATVAHVALELWLEEREGVYDESLVSGARSMLARPEVRALVDRAGERSVYSPSWPGDSLDTVAALNAFACAATLMGDRDRARDLLDRTGGVYSYYPWCYLSANPRTAYAWAQQTAGVPRPTLQEWWDTISPATRTVVVGSAVASAALGGGLLAFALL